MMKDLNIVNIKNVEIKCDDGVLLSNTLFEPETSPHGVIILASALGVPRKIYKGIAQYFASHGYLALTFDYRGQGDIPLNSSENAPRLSEWGTKDLHSVIEWAAAQQGGDNLYLVGHSIGGQVLGLAPAASKLRGSIFIASSFPYWRRHSAPQKYGIRFLFGFLFPLICSIKNEFPAKAFGLSSVNLPSSLMKDWSRWIRKEDYLLDPTFGFDKKVYQDFQKPILAFGFSDDHMVPKASYDKIITIYSGAVIEERFIQEAKSEFGGIGHFGFFKEKHKNTLWKEALHWIKDVNKNASKA